ncbi:metabolite traffic protein EboE [Xanthocytophaga flava]|uniref:metabolite traffic protein EboE n=1 Tax=Xanthocytophaga flava TaxID=3048013 RepID=UPI0028D7B263|nr:metabolite traffic protein EboE [Xanthocytophaga flavus]MDJ1470645.1 metabolite traffic protein EboE [Xanthocytophaga flavus]
MHLSNNIHLTYCTNIHAGESWKDIFQSLQEYVLPLKESIAPDNAFAIGLRLPDQASRTLIQPAELDAFKKWLTEHNLYVFTMNGFPYGGFHRQRVKDDVHRPDWTTTERRDYTIRLAQILAELPNVPDTCDKCDAGISTSPLSYRGWYTNPSAHQDAIRKGCLHMAEVVKELVGLSLEKGKVIHIDIEPEPDGSIDHVQDTIELFNKTLIPIVTAYLVDNLSVKHDAAEELARTHIQLCYDVCHFAVMYEEPAAAVKAFKEAGIRIGKIQISAALKADLPTPVESRGPLLQAFQNLSESTYLHQVVARKTNLHANENWAVRQQYPDLSDALPHIFNPDVAEWRTHFHVPLFIKDYGLLQSTQEDIEKVLSIQKSSPFTHHLEIETYTWEVLPAELKINLKDSIEREIKWVLNYLKQ